jgi:uncharacterized delta-60 repeat protein
LVVRPKVARSLVLLLVAVLACALPAAAAAPFHPGALDRSFSGDGFTLMDFGNEPWLGSGSEVASLPDGRFLVLVNTRRGDSVMRFEVDGSVDRSFGTGGLRLLAHPVSAMELAPGGKIVVAGYANLSADEASADFAVTRLTPDGRLDRGFGGDGSVVFAGRPGGEGAGSVLVRPDGRITVLGRITDRPVWGIEVAELDHAGRLVPGFGRDGVAVFPVPAENVSTGISRIEPQGARTIVLLGHPGAGEGGLLRLNPDGTKDPTFGVDGEVTSRQIDAVGGSGSSRYYSSSAPAGLAVAADGSIVITTENASVTRLLPDGAPDPGFGQGGRAHLGSLESEGVYALRPYTVSLDAEGRALLAGRAELGSDPETRISALLTARLQPDGALDPSFGGDGFAITPVEGEGWLYDLALLPGGKALAVGGSGSRYGLGRRVTAARYEPDGELDPGFGAAGIARTPALIPAADEAVALLVDRHGRTFAAGAAGGKAALLSLRPGGGLDTGFGKGGRVTPIDGDDFFPERVGALARYPDGRLLVGAGSKSSGAVLRYRADGSLDSSFGRDGVAGASCLEMIQSLAVLPDGRILVAGRDYGPSKVAFTRLLPGGAPDPGFGSEKGCVYSGYFGPWGGQPSITVKALPGGKILLGGNSGESFLTRYSADGVRDREFHAFAGAGLYPARIFDFAVDRAGRIVVAGLAAKEGRIRRKRALLVRLLPSGRVDRSFSRDGVVVRNLSDFTTFDAVGLEPGGRAVAGGTMYRLCGIFRSCPSHIFVTRFEPDGTPDRSFGRGGIWRRQFEGGSRLTSLALGPRTITVGGWSRGRPADNGLLVARLHR